MALATLARLLLPSTPCSILTIQSPTQSAALPARIWQNVIAATDFSHASVAALEIAQRIAGHGLIVLHSTQSGKEQDSHHCMTKLRMLAPFNESHTLPVEHLVHPGNVIDAIAFAERKMHADLLVLGAPSVAVDTGNLDDSTIYRLIIDSTCPVLLVPPGTALGEETIDKAVRAWMENAQCVDGRPPVGGH
jgi:hypothetical protein